MITGECFCGRITYRIDGKLRDARSCHCSRCRKAFSSQASAYAEVDPDEFEWTAGSDNLQTYTGVEGFGISFCKTCGSNLYYRMIDSDELQLSAGLLDDQSNLSLSRQFFTDLKPPFYTLADETDNMTSEEIYAAFAARSE